MGLPHVHYPAVLTAGAVIFILGGLWYSRALFATAWVNLMGKTEEELKAGASAMPLMLILAFGCALLIAWTLAVVLNHFGTPTPARGAMVGALCWAGFAGATSFATAIFSSQPRLLWLINTGYNLVSFVLAGIILAAWR